jgi:hypothetical protein
MLQYVLQRLITYSMQLQALTVVRHTNTDITVMIYIYNHTCKAKQDKIKFTSVAMSKHSCLPVGIVNLARLRVPQEVGPKVGPVRNLLQKTKNSLRQSFSTGAASFVAPCRRQ